MSSITITPTSTPVANTPTPCVVRVDNGNTIVEYDVVFPENMFTMISNPPSLKDYAKTIDVSSTISTAVNAINKDIAELREDISNLPRVTDTSNFITNDKLDEEITARTEALSSVNKSISDINTKLSSVDTSISSINKDISDRVETVTKAAALFRDKLAAITTLKESNISSGGTDNDTTVVDIVSSKDGLVVSTKAGVDTIYVNKEYIDTKLDDLNTNVSKAIETAIEDINKNISDVINAIVSGNKTVTSSVVSLIESGVK